MTESLRERLREHPRAWLLALALACCFAYFVGPPAWNQNSRLALTRALVERGQVTIDEWHATTGDKSFRDGHFYSDKAPGVSLLSLVPYGLFVAQRRMSGGELPDVRVVPLDPAIAAANQAPAPEDREPGDVLVYNPAHRFALWWCRFVVISLPSVLAGLLGYLLCFEQLRVRVPEPLARVQASTIAALWLLATPALGYACGLYGHQIVAALLFSSFALVVLQPSTRKPGLPLAIGTMLGWAVLCEYTAAVPVVMIVAWIAWRRGVRFATWTAIGGLPWALVLAGYHQWAFGSPLKTGYDFVYLEEFAEGMAVNYGIGPPRLDVLGQLLFGSYRGLFYLAPVLLLAAWGLPLAWLEASRGRPSEAPDEHRSSTPLRRMDLLLAAAMVVFYLLLNSGYYMWDGGAALGPRHAVPMLPFLCLGFMPALARVPWATLVLGAVSCLQIVLITAAAPEAPSYGNPLWSYAVPRLFSEPSPGGATTLGHLLGLPGPLALVPLVLLGWVLGREITRDRLHGSHDSSTPESAA